WWRPDPRWAAGLILELNRAEQGEGVFRGGVAAARLTWTPTVDIAAKLFTQFNSETDQGGFNLLVSWRYRPRSYLHIVWDGGWTPGRGVPLTRDRALLIKAAYLLDL
ncbi:MAG: hypothetical protein R6W82_04050, partial [bacterium]